MNVLFWFALQNNNDFNTFKFCEGVIISLYARGMTTREIQGHLAEIYGVEVSPALISTVTDAVNEEVKTWQNRSLDTVYSIVYMDAIRVKGRATGHVLNKAVYLAIGITMEGVKECWGCGLLKPRVPSFGYRL